MTWVIDSGVYYAAADKCRLLAGDLCLALGPLHSTLLHECGGMAGDHKDSEAWTTAYNKHATDIVTLAATLANALQRSVMSWLPTATTGGMPTAPQPAAPNPNAPPPPNPSTTPAWNYRATPKATTVPASTKARSPGY